MSITRVGLSETERFSVGYDAIFGGRRAATKGPSATKKKNKRPAVKKKTAKKKR